MAPGLEKSKKPRDITVSGQHEASFESHILEVPPELVRLAAERYPGYPLPLALAKLLNDVWVLRTVRPVKGLMWGGVHEENIPDIVAKLVRSMYEGPRPIRSITIKIKVGDPSCEDYTHFWVEILDVEEPGEEGELQPDGGFTAEELFRELERAIEAELAEARDRLAELQERAIPGSIRSKMVSCGKADCGKCPHGPYYYLKRPDGSEEYLGREVPPEIEDG
ncbi:hypothetical protein B6U66_01730, partial [Candidatus Bathyarchaeota archaeon ex4484_135]